jgi:plastocyanin
MGNFILQNENDDGIDRRGFLKCMAWTGTGALWIMSGGILKSYGLSQIIDKGTGGLKDGLKIPKGDFSFVQISDTHIGFNKEANPDVVATLQAAISKINATPGDPSFILHTGDLSHLSKASEFDTLDQVLKTAHPEKVFFVPGEHDMLTDNGKQYLDRYGKGTKGGGWYSFDSHGTHFMGLVNVMNLKAGGMGNLGHEQLEWIEDDLRGLSKSTPVVVFAHIPLWSVYPQWGWGTDDSERALSYLKRFGSVTVLNGHIHQTMQKIEGNITFHTAMSTAFPQPAPGAAPSPGPMKVPAEKLRSMLGLAGVYYLENKHTLAIIDSPLPGAGADASGGQQDTTRKSKDRPAGANEVSIDNFSFAPKELTVAVGTTVKWTNRDDIPHTVVATEGQFKSGVLDTDQSFSFTFSKAGVYDYYCSIHTHMVGKITVA